MEIIPPPGYEIGWGLREWGEAPRQYKGGTSYFDKLTVDDSGVPDSVHIDDLIIVIRKKHRK